MAEQQPGRWLLRFKVVNDMSKKLIFNDDFQFKRDVVNVIDSLFNSG